MDVSKRFFHGECKCLFEIKEGVQGVLWKNILLADLLGSHHLSEMLQTSLTFKNSKKEVKNGCFEKHLQWRLTIFFRKKGGI